MQFNIVIHCDFYPFYICVKCKFCKNVVMMIPVIVVVVNCKLALFCCAYIAVWCVVVDNCVNINKWCLFCVCKKYALLFNAL